MAAIWGKRFGEVHGDSVFDNVALAREVFGEESSHRGRNADQFCDITTGACKSDTCQSLQCPAGKRCIQNTGTCEADPCAFVQCPLPCYACDVTSAGTATCKFLNDAQHPQCAIVQLTTGQKGGGCTCAVAPGETSSNFALALAALGLVMTVRPRRRRGKR